jgi:pimeloyl-ACP methyl ester carboxylesterase
MYIWFGSAAAIVVAVLVGWSIAADAVLGRRQTPPAGDAGQFATVDGVRVYYRIAGQGAALVLLHGLALSHLSWNAITAALAQRFTVYSLDLPGFGYSDKPDGYGSARQEAAFVARFLSTLGITHATVIGHSMGGAVALWLGAEHSARIDRLVLVNATEIGNSAAIFNLVATPILGDMLIKTTTPTTLRFLIADPYVHKEVVTRELAEQYARFLWMPGARQALIEHARSYEVDRGALRPMLARVALPTLIVWSDRDPYFSLSVARELLGALPSASLQVIQDAGHVPHEEQPAQFARVVLDWLSPP